jgi:hypothetical protein
VTERVERWTTFARDRQDVGTLQKPEKRQPLRVVVQMLSVSLHKEGFYVSTGQCFRSLNQIPSQLPRRCGVKNDVARVAELAIGNKQVRWVGIEPHIIDFESEGFADSQATAR